jgi:uncharacterized protein YacL
MLRTFVEIAVIIVCIVLFRLFHDSLDHVTIKGLLIVIIVALAIIYIGIAQELKKIREILELKEHFWKKQLQKDRQEELELI